MQVVINGEPRTIAKPMSVSDLVRELELGDLPLLIELNGKALQQREHNTETVTDGAKIELVRIVAGG